MGVIPHVLKKLHLRFKVGGTDSLTAFRTGCGPFVSQNGHHLVTIRIESAAPHGLQRNDKCLIRQDGLDAVELRDPPPMPGVPVIARRKRGKAVLGRRADDEEVLALAGERRGRGCRCGRDGGQDRQKNQHPGRFKQAFESLSHLKRPLS